MGVGLVLFFWFWLLLVLVGCFFVSLFLCFNEPIVWWVGIGLGWVGLGWGGWVGCVAGGGLSKLFG